MPEPKAAKIAELIPNIEISHAPATPTVMEAPVMVVAPGSIATGGGAAALGDVGTEGGSFTGRDVATSDLRYNSVGSSVQFTNSDNSKLWEANMRLLQDIANVAFRLDDVPQRLKDLEGKLNITPLTVPVTVPVTVPINIQMREWLLIILIILVLVIGAYLIGRGI